MLAASGVALVAVGLVSGCSAGQLAATAEIVPAVPGGSVLVNFHDPANPNSAVLVQNAVIAPSVGGYKVGSDAPLQLRIINQTPGVITVTPDSATLQAPVGGTVGNDKPVGTLTWASSKTPVEAPSPSPSLSPSGQPSGSPSGSPSGAPSETPTPPAAPALKDLTIQPGPAGLLILTPGSDQFLTISNLTQPLRPGDIVNLTLKFTDAAGETQSGTVAMPIGPPSTAVTRAPVGTTTS
jgi:hypothetical protein